MADYSDWMDRHPSPPGLSDVPPSGGGSGGGDDILAWLEENFGNWGGGGGGYRPQTPEEAALLKAQAKDIPLGRELARRMAVAQIGAKQAEIGANPRRIFEALFHQVRVKPTRLAKKLQKKVTIPGFARGGEGPVVAEVGERGAEYALLPPGSVVAPKPRGEKATVGNALSAIISQMAEGGVVSKEKAREILAHGSVHGEELTDKQRGLFGLIAAGKRPTRLHKAQGGLGVPQSVQDEYEKRRLEATTAVIGATKMGTRGTSLFDPLGGGQFTDKQKQFLGGLNLRRFTKMSPTQQKALFSMLSAGRVDPEDFAESMQRQFAGFNPIGAGTRTAFSGVMGR